MRDNAADGPLDEDGSIRISPETLSMIATQTLRHAMLMVADRAEQFAPDAKDTTGDVALRAFATAMRRTVAIHQGSPEVGEAIN